jgi:long-chain fatty acid transport protein
MKQVRKSATTLALFALLCTLTLVPAAHATNGMNMEGYGPIATGMGGASFAYDNGTAAIMNNPATLSLMESKARLDLAIGFLAPDITSSVPGASAKSSADLFTMPAFGYARKSGDLVYGVGVFAQGGMGTEYGADSFLAFNSGDSVRSELGVGRFIIPFSYSVNKDLAVAVSLDYVWATLDLKMALPGSVFGGLVTNCSGPVCPGLPGLGASPWVRLDFSGGGDMNGAAKGTGFAGKIGAVYKISPEFTIGATYHSKTSLSDLETDSSGALLSAPTPSGTPAVIGAGKIKVVDFQWPATYGIGVAWNANKKLLVAADLKVIGWKSVMKDFKMTYEGPVMGAPGNTINFALPQNWKDQTVVELGAAYLITPEFTGRVGVNLANNPIPDADMNYLFPAIIENTYTLGAGYAFSKASSIDFSFTYAPEVKQTAGSGITTTHSQMNEQIMFSYRF